MNITSAIISGSKILRNKFISSHQLDSEILMAKTIKKDRNYILLNSDSVLNKNDLNYFFRLIEQRSLGSPVAYLINKKFLATMFCANQFVMLFLLLINKKSLLLDDTRSLANEQG